MCGLSNVERWQQWCWRRRVQSSMTKNEKNKNKNWVISPFTVPTLHRGRGLRIIGVNDRPTRILHEFRQSLLEFCILYVVVVVVVVCS